MPNCPVCDASFPQSQLQRHVNECLDRHMAGAAETPAPAPRAVTPTRERPAPRRRSISPPARRPSPPVTPVARPAPPRTVSRPSTAGAGAGATAASGAAAGSAAAAAPEVTTREVQDLVDAIHIRRFDEPSAGDSGAGGAGTGASSGAKAGAALTGSKWKPEYKPIRGLFYVRVLEVQVPPSKEFLALGHRTPYVDVSFEGETFTTAISTAAPGSVAPGAALPTPPPPAGTAPSAVSSAASLSSSGKGSGTASGGAGDAAAAASAGATAVWTDEEFLFNIEHYFGGAGLSLEVYERSMFGRRTPLGKLSITAGEVVQRQLALYRRLGIAYRTDSAGNLAIDTEEADGGRTAIVKNGLAGPRGPAGYNPRDDPAVAAWFSRGVNPTLQDAWFTLSSCRLRVQFEFMFAQTHAPLGPRGVQPVHRAAAGGQVKLLRFLWKADWAGPGSLDAKTRDPPEFAYRAIDFAAEGVSEPHARCVSFILHAMRGTVDESGAPRSGAGTLAPAGRAGKLCLAALNGELPRRLGLTDGDLRHEESNVVHRAAGAGAVDPFHMLLVPASATAGAKTGEILGSRNLYQRTPFLEAAAAGSVPILEAMGSVFGLEYSAALARRDLHGNDAMLLAASAGHAAAVAFLARKGGNSNSRNTHRQTPLHLAAAATNDAAGAATIAALAKVKAASSIDDKGKRPLHHAAAAGNVLCVRELLSSAVGEVPAAEDSAGLTPWAYAAELYNAATGSSSAGTGSAAAASILRGATGTGAGAAAADTAAAGVAGAASEIMRLLEAAMSPAQTTAARERLAARIASRMHHGGSGDKDKDKDDKDADSSAAGAGAGTGTSSRAGTASDTADSVATATAVTPAGMTTASGGSAFGKVFGSAGGSGAGAAPQPAPPAAGAAPLKSASIWEEDEYGDDDSYAYVDEDDYAAHHPGLARGTSLTGGLPSFPPSLLSAGSGGSAGHGPGAGIASAGPGGVVLRQPSSHAAAGAGAGAGLGFPPAHPSLAATRSSSQGSTTGYLGMPLRRPGLGKTPSTEGLEYGRLAPPDPLSLQRQRSVEVYEPDDVAAMQRRILLDVSTVLRVPMTAAGIMLRHHKWDTQGLMSAYYADAAGVAKACGVRPEVDAEVLLKRYRDGKARNAGRGATAASSAAHEDDAEDMCPACMSDVPRWKLLSAGCDHDMCTDCWRGHLSARLAEFGKDVHFLGGCPDPGCGAIIPESVWLEMANDHDRTVYTQHVIHSYIPLTGQVVWCPNPKCTRALRYRNAHSDLTCLCGQRFCVTCTLEAHSPATCEEYTRWKEDSEGLKDVLTMRVLMKDYKKCPKCGVYLDRTAGCNHMTCRAPCNHQWCFMCKGPWSEHGSHTGGHYKCNIYEKEKDKKTNADWEGYSAEEKERFLSDTNESRAKAFEAVQSRVRQMQDGMDRSRHRLAIVKKAIADPTLLLRKHGIKLAAAASKAGDAAAASAAAADASGAGPSLSDWLHLRRFLLERIETRAERNEGREAMRERERLEAAGRRLGWRGSSILPPAVTRVRRGGPASDSEEDSSDEDEEPEGGDTFDASRRLGGAGGRAKARGGRRRGGPGSDHKEREEDEDGAAAGAEEEDEDEDNDPFAPKPVKAAAGRPGTGAGAGAGAAPASGVPVAAASASTGAAAKSPTLDPRIEYVLQQERRRLLAMQQALEALHEFHRVEKWCLVHLFYEPPGPGRALLEFKQGILEGHAGTLFEMLESPAKLAILEEGALREYTKAVAKFCKNLVEEVETTAMAAAAARGKGKAGIKLAPTFPTGAGAGAGARSAR